MGGRLIPILAFALIAVACTDGSVEPTPTTVNVTTSTTTGEPDPDPEPNPGLLAVVDDGGGIVVMNPDGTDRRPVAAAGTSQNPAVYMQPVWSPDGSSLAWGQTTGTGFGVGISQLGSDLITTLTTPNLPFFTYWSPDSRYLGLLHNGTSGVQFQIADIDEETTSLIDENAPLYFSWSPDGGRVVTHAGQGQVESVGVDGDRMSLEPTSPTYLAPQWTDRGVFHVVDDRLVVEDEQGGREVLADVTGAVVTMFVANPLGTRMAMQSSGDGAGPITAALEEIPAPPADAVVVLDTTTAEVDVASELPAVGFFWSPDGERLLVLAAEDGQITPLVWDAGGVSTYPPYIPHPTLLQTTFPFFPQYAQSVSFWSPDSSAFAYAGASGDVAGVWVQEVAGEEPLRVSDGSWVAWSPGT
jgi:TolB protein